MVSGRLLPYNGGGCPGQHDGNLRRSAYGRRPAMSITVTCPNCSASFRASDDHAGKRGKCPKCQAVIQVPRLADPPAEPAAQVFPKPAVAAATPSPSKTTPADAQAPGRPAPTQPQILAAFDGAIEPVDLSLTYQLGVLLVLIVMVILPLVYIALIGLVCYGVYLHAVYDIGVVGAAGGDGPRSTPSCSTWCR